MPDARKPANTVLHRGDPDVLVGEFTLAQSRVDALAAELAAAVKERNAVLAALAAETGLTYREMSERTGMAPWRISTALHNDWRDTRDAHA